MNKYKVLGLGTNIGDRIENLNLSIQILKENNIEIIKKSSVYETEPVDCKDKEWFLNQVIIVKTDKTVFQTRKICKDIEQEMGRKSSYKNSPRIIDIDILLWENDVIEEKDFLIPHTRMCGRKFVMIPLMEVIPDLKLLLWIINNIHNQKIKKYEK